MSEIPTEAVQAAMSAEDSITQALLRWREPVSRNARQIAKAALLALDGNGYPVGPQEMQRRTTFGGQPAIDTSFEDGKWVLRLPCLCCGAGQVRIALTPAQARDLAETFQDEPKEETDEPDA